MADYNGVMKSNMFRVTNEEKLKHILSFLRGDCEIEIWREQKEDGIYFGFGSYSSQSFYEDEDSDEVDDDKFYELLQEILHPDDVIIITEVGNEKLCYLNAYSIIISKGEIDAIDLDSLVLDKLREIDQQKDWR